MLFLFLVSILLECRSYIQGAFVDWAHMEFLRLADYELPSLLLSPGEGGRPQGGQR